MPAGAFPTVERFHLDLAARIGEARGLLMMALERLQQQGDPTEAAASLAEQWSTWHNDPTTKAVLRNLAYAIRTNAAPAPLVPSAGPCGTCGVRHGIGVCPTTVRDRVRRALETLAVDWTWCPTYRDADGVVR